MRLQPLLILIPGLVGIFCLLAFSLTVPRSTFSRKMRRLIALISCFFLFASLSFNSESKMMLHFVLLEQVCALALVPGFLSFIREYDESKTQSLVFRICCMIPLIHLVMGVESVYVAGFEESVRIYMESLAFVGPMFPYLDKNGQIVFYACYTYMFKAFVLVNFLLFALNMMKCAVGKSFKVSDFISFMFKNGECDHVPVLYYLSLGLFLIVVPVLVLGKSCYSGKIMITVIASLVLMFAVFGISIVSIAGPIGKQSFKTTLLSVCCKKTSRI